MAGQFDPAIFHVLNWRFIFHILVEKPLALLLLCVLHRHIMQIWAYGPTTSTGGTQMPLTDFVLAVAMICPRENTVAVQEILTPEPITHRACEELSRNEQIRRDYFQKFEIIDGCNLELICVRVYWKE